MAPHRNTVQSLLAADNLKKGVQKVQQSGSPGNQNYLLEWRKVLNSHPSSVDVPKVGKRPIPKLKQPLLPSIVHPKLTSRWTTSLTEADRRRQENSSCVNPFSVPSRGVKPTAQRPKRKLGNRQPRIILPQLHVRDSAAGAGGVSNSLEAPVGSALDAKRPECTFPLLVALAIESSQHGCLTVKEIYQFIQKEFEYYKYHCRTNWKNSVRHCLSENDAFVKVKVLGGRTSTQGCRWTLSTTRKPSMQHEIMKFLKKDVVNLRHYHSLQTYYEQLVKSEPCRPSTIPIASADNMDAIDVIFVNTLLNTPIAESAGNFDAASAIDSLNPITIEDIHTSDLLQAEVFPGLVDGSGDSLIQKEFVNDESFCPTSTEVDEMDDLQLIKWLLDDS